MYLYEERDNDYMKVHIDLYQKFSVVQPNWVQKRSSYRSLNFFSNFLNKSEEHEYLEARGIGFCLIVFDQNQE